MNLVHYMFKTSTRIFFVLLFAQAAYAEILVTVSTEPGTLGNIKALYCSAIADGANRVQDTHITCLDRIGTNARDPRFMAAQNSKKFNYYIELVESRGILKIKIHNWSSTDDTEFKSTLYELRTRNNSNWRYTLHKLVNNLMGFHIHKNAYKNYLIDNMYTNSKLIGKNDENKFVLLQTAEIISPKYAYNVYNNESRANHINLRIGMELAAVYAFGTAWKLNINDNQLSWNNYSKGSHSPQMLRSANRLIDDYKAYGILKKVDLNATHSFLHSATANAFWEFAADYDQLTSNSDTILSQLNGTVIGDALTDTANAWSEANGCASKMAIIKVSALMRLLTGAQENNQERTICNTSPDNRIAEVSISTGYLNIAGKSAVPLALQTEVLSLPFENNKNAQLIMPRIVHAKIAAQSDDLSDPGGSYSLLAQLAYIAYYKQNIRRDSDSRPRGYQLVVSPSSRFELLDRSYDKSDFIANINFFGPRAQVIGHFKGYRISLVMEFYKDFALVSSYALSDRDRNAQQDEYNNLPSNQSRYSGFGQTGRAEISVSNAYIKAGAEFQNSEINTNSGHDSRDVQHTHDLDLSDSYRKFKVYIEISPKNKISFEISYENIHRLGQIDNRTRDSISEDRIMAKVKYNF